MANGLLNSKGLVSVQCSNTQFNLDEYTIEKRNNIYFFRGIDSGINEGTELPAGVYVAISICGIQVACSDSACYMRFNWGTWKKWKEI